MAHLKSRRLTPGLAERKRYAPGAIFGLHKAERVERQQPTLIGPAHPGTALPPGGVQLGEMPAGKGMKAVLRRPAGSSHPQREVLDKGLKQFKDANYDKYIKKFFSKK